MRVRASRQEELYLRALLIIDRRANGYFTPILQHLALRNHCGAMVQLADFADFHGKSCNFGSANNLLYKAVRRGSWLAAQNLAMNAFNSYDLHRYRYWLRLAAKLGDTDSAIELRKFETRLPHLNALRIRRKRPYRRSELR